MEIGHACLPPPGPDPLSVFVAGYKVFCIIDASGNWSKMATEITTARVTQARAIPTDTYAVLAEL
jgi:hypothetical protein